MIGERIKTAREARGLKRKQLCELAGITESALSRYENETREPQAAVLGKIAQILNVSTDFLIGNADELERKVDTIDSSIIGSLQHKIINKIQYRYIKDIVSNLKLEVGNDINKLMSELRLSTSYLQEDIHYNFKAIYNNILGKQYLFLNPNISKLEETAIIFHIIGYIMLFNNPNTYCFYDFTASDKSNTGRQANIFAAEYLIDDDIFLNKLTIGDDTIIANELQVPLNFIEHKRNLIIR